MQRVPPYTAFSFRFAHFTYFHILPSLQLFDGKTWTSVSPADVTVNGNISLATTTRKILEVCVLSLACSLCFLLCLSVRLDVCLSPFTRALYSVSYSISLYGSTCLSHPLIRALYCVFVLFIFLISVWLYSTAFSFFLSITGTSPTLSLYGSTFVSHALTRALYCVLTLFLSLAPRTPC